jgi:hypothetical protein
MRRLSSKSNSALLRSSSFSTKHLRPNGTSLYKGTDIVPPGIKSEVVSNLARLEKEVFSSKSAQSIGKEGFAELINQSDPAFLGVTFDDRAGSISGPFIGFAYAYKITKQDINERDIEAIADSIGEDPKQFTSKVMSVFKGNSSVVYLSEGAKLVSNTDKVEHAKLCAELFLSMAHSRCGFIAQIPKDLCSKIIFNLQAKGIVDLSVYSEIPDFFGPGKPAIMFCGTFTGKV